MFSLKMVTVSDLSDQETWAFRPNVLSFTKWWSLKFYIHICLVYLCDPADLAFVRGAVAGSRQRALLNGASAVQGNVRGSAQVKWIVGVVVQLVGVCQVLLTGCQNLASLKKEIFLQRRWWQENDTSTIKAI